MFRKTTPDLSRTKNAKLNFCQKSANLTWHELKRIEKRIIFRKLLDFSCPSRCQNDPIYYVGRKKVSMKIKQIKKSIQKWKDTKVPPPLVPNRELSKIHGPCEKFRGSRLIRIVLENNTGSKYQGAIFEWNNFWSLSII